MPLQRPVVLLLLCLFTLSSVALSSDDHAEGETRPEPPHRRAALQSGYGETHLPITCDNRLSQLYFDQALAMLHGFDTRAASQSFHSILNLEPDCAMAYWGLAMAHFKYPRTARQYLQEALDRQEKASPRERQWIAALQESRLVSNVSAARQRLVDSLHRLASDHPEDLEAKALYVREVMASGSGLRQGEQIRAWIRDVLENNPHHPLVISQVIFWSSEDPPKARTAVEKEGDA